MHFKNVPLHRYPLRNEFYPNNFCVVSFVGLQEICNKRKAFYDLLRVTTYGLGFIVDSVKTVWSKCYARRDDLVYKQN